MCVAVLIHFLVGMCVGDFCTRSKLTNIRAKWFCVKKSTWQYRLSDIFFLCVEAEFCHIHGKKLLYYLILSKEQHIVVSLCTLFWALTSICWNKSTRSLKAPFVCLDIRLNFLQGSHWVFCSCIFHLHLSQIKCRYPGSTLTGNLVPQLGVQDRILTSCQPCHFVISLDWNSRKNLLHICNISRWFGCSKSVANINYNNDFKSCEQLKHWSFSVGGFLDVFCFTLMLWREHSSCRMFFMTSLGQMRCLNVESQEGFLPCLCSALKFKSNYFYETCNSEVPDCQFLWKNWRTTSLLDPVWLSGKWILCLLSGWIVAVLFSIYNWKGWKSVTRIKSLGQRKLFSPPFGDTPVTLRHSKDSSLCYHYFCSPPLLPGLKDLSSYPSCSKLTCGINRLRHEPFPGKDIINTLQGWEHSLSHTCGQMSQPLSPLATDRQAAQLETQCHSCKQPGCEKKSNLVEREEIRVMKYRVLWKYHVLKNLWSQL